MKLATPGGPAMPNGLLFDIQRNSYADGPGIRTTVFFKGCNLSCKWCHNPESQRQEKEMLFYPYKCTGCGNCKNATIHDEMFFCVNDAKEICGKEYAVDEVLTEILKDQPFYITSGGGVTFSGGECMLQLPFLLDLLKKCKEHEIHTAVDTAGHIPWTSFAQILPYTDLFLYDIKIMDNDAHRAFTGVSNTLILENLAKILRSGTDVWVRVPVIAGVNDSEDEMKKLKAFFDQNRYPEKVELLPYHAMGEHKYAALGKTVHRFQTPPKEKIEKLRKLVAPY